jgi:NAD(P)-dependent dehydrogenase (short-subunit alcohol dehydrogenase family)
MGAQAGRLSGKAALITGAGQGIGAGVARAFVREGASVVLAGRTLQKVADVAADLGNTAVPISCDVTDRDQVIAAVDTAVERFGGLDILVNNAQSFSVSPILETTDEDVELAWRSGPLATLYGIQAAVPHMRTRGGGCIVNFGTSAALTGDALYTAYAMAKEAIRGLTRVAVRELGPDNIRVNVVVPNAMSPAAETFREQQPSLYSQAVAETPLGRLGDCETDIGNALAALVSDDMQYVTGATLMLGGGRTIWG